MSVESFINRWGGLTEEYKFYNGEVTLRYDKKAHVYLLVTPEGTLEPQDGVTDTVHIIDKSKALVPWGCSMMEQKLLATAQPYRDNTQLGEPESYKFGLDEFGTLIRKAKSAHLEKLEEAGNIGHIAHEWIERYIKAVLSNNQSLVHELLAKLPEDERAANCCQAALDWMQKHNVRWISTERKVYSRTYKYAGTMDGMCLTDSCGGTCCPVPFKDRLTLADWKTSNYLYLEYLLQVSAYQQAHEEEKPDERIDDSWIIRLGKLDAEFDPWHVDRAFYPKHFLAFRNALDLRRSVKAIETDLQSAKDERTKIRKELERQEKEAALKIACKNSGRYKGTRKPTCNGGHPCESCLKRYSEVQEEKALTKSKKSGNLNKEENTDGNSSKRIRSNEVV